MPTRAVRERIFSARAWEVSGATCVWSISLLFWHERPSRNTCWPGGLRYDSCVWGRPGGPPHLVRGRLFDVIDDQNLDRTFGGFQSEAQLFLDRREYGGAGRMVSRWLVGRPHCLAGIRRPLQLEIVLAGESGPVDHRAADHDGQTTCEEPHVRSQAGQFASADALDSVQGPVSIRFGLLEFRPALCEDEYVDGKFLGLAMEIQLETVA